MFDGSAIRHPAAEAGLKADTPIDATGFCKTPLYFRG